MHDWVPWGWLETEGGVGECESYRICMLMRQRMDLMALIEVLVVRELSLGAGEEQGQLEDVL